MTITFDSPALASSTHKAAFDLRGAEADLHGKSAILLVSVGAAYHEGDKLGATVDLINRSGLAHITVSVADTLQRHNVAHVGEADAYTLTRAEGDRWIERNTGYLSYLETGVTVQRWDTALSDVRYPGLLTKVENAYRTDASYREAVDATITRFLTRRFGDLDDPANAVDPAEVDAARAGCLGYLLEECPVIQPLWATQGFDFVIYPQHISAAMARTGELFVEPEHPGAVSWLPLRFKKRKSAR